MDQTSDNNLGWAPMPAEMLLDKSIPPMAKMLYAYLVWRAGQRGVAWPGIAKIADDLGISEHSVRLRLSDLAKYGWIERKRRYGQSSLTTILARATIDKTPEKPAKNTPSNRQQVSGSAHDEPAIRQQVSGRTANRLADEPLTGWPTELESLNKNHRTRTINNIGAKITRHGGGSKQLTPLQEATKSLEVVFSEISSIPLPARETEREKREARSAWWVPLGDIWKMCGEDVAAAKETLGQSYRRLAGKSMTISSPRSLLKTATAIVAEGKNGNGAAGGSFDWSSMSDEDIAKENERLNPHRRRA